MQIRKKCVRSVTQRKGISRETDIGNSLETFLGQNNARTGPLEDSLSLTYICWVTIVGLQLKGQDC